MICYWRTRKIKNFQNGKQGTRKVLAKVDDDENDNVWICNECEEESDDDKKNLSL